MSPARRNIPGTIVEIKALERDVWVRAVMLDPNGKVQVISGQDNVWDGCVLKRGQYKSIRDIKEPSSAKLEQ